MLDYLQFSDLDGEIPLQFLTQALDDDNDGVIDMWEKVKTSTEEDVDALLEGRFTVPLTLNPMPRIINRAAVAFFCERCYRRRNTPDADNPWKGRADAFRKILAAINEGDLRLAAGSAAVAVQPDDGGSILAWDSELGEPGRRVLG